jgi:hypothetical protein
MPMHWNYPYFKEIIKYTRLHLHLLQGQVSYSSAVCSGRVGAGAKTADSED